MFCVPAVRGTPESAEGISRKTAVVATTGTVVLRPGNVLSGILTSYIENFIFLIRENILPDMAFSTTTLTEALETLGELLTERGHVVEVVAIGGGSLLLLDLIKRPTKDLDIVAIVRAGSYVTAKPLPDFLIAAVRDVAEVAGLTEDWLNPGPTSLLDFGLPADFEQRVETQRYGGLVVHIASRFDQICFKLYACVDQGPRSKHAQDLRTLRPTPEELRAAAAWCTTQDPSEGFAGQLDLALGELGVRDEP